MRPEGRRPKAEGRRPKAEGEIVAGWRAAAIMKPASIEGFM